MYLLYNFCYGGSTPFGLGEKIDSSTTQNPPHRESNWVCVGPHPSNSRCNPDFDPSGGMSGPVLSDFWLFIPGENMSNFLSLVGLNLYKAVFARISRRPMYTNWYNNRCLNSTENDSQNDTISNGGV